MTTREPGVAHGTCHHKIYELTCDDFEELLARADGHCEICRKPASEAYRGILAIDHDPIYGYGAVRGMVCEKCNSHLRQVDEGRRSRFKPPRTYEYYMNAWFMRPRIRLPKRPDSIDRTDPSDRGDDPSRSTP